MSASDLVLNQLNEEQALRKRREELSELESGLAEREAELHHDTVTDDEVITAIKSVPCHY